jgi:hypothetical protein
MRRAAVAFLLGFSLACGHTPSAPADARTSTIGLDGHTNATPSLAARGDRVVLTWTASQPDGSGADVFAAVSTDGGRTFGAPVRVNDRPGTARNSGEQAPRVAIDDDTIAVVWAAKQGSTSDVMYARSTDGGRTFSRGQAVHPAGLSGLRGWASIAIDRDRHIHVLWLDGRNATATPAMPMQMPMSHAAHVHGGDHALDTSSPRQDLFHATIDPDGLISERLVAADVCFCCKTAVVPRPDGSTFVAWRHIFPGSARDIGSALLLPASDAPAAIARVSEDHWHLEACPDDGPAAVVDRTGGVHVAWPTLVDGHKAVFYAHAADGRTFSARERVDADDANDANHPQIALTTGGRVVVLWDEATSGGTAVLGREKNLETNRWERQTAIAGDGDNRYPAAAISNAGLVIAWTQKAASGSRIVVEAMPQG